MSNGESHLGRDIRRDANADDPATLERRSDAIRADVGQTLDALQRNYSPGALLDRSLDLFKEHGGELSANLGRSVKQNPVPALLTLVGIGWMMVSQNRGTSYRYDEDDYDLYDDDAYVDEDVYLEVTATGLPEGEISSATGNADDQTSSKGDGEGLKEKLGAAREKVRDARHSAADSMRRRRRRISERSHRAADRAAYRARRARDGFEHMLEEQPFVVGAVGVALGALIGAMLPESEREDRMLGEARDRALERAKEVGTRSLERASGTAPPPARTGTIP